MWSLTSQRERRTSGPENFQSSAKKDFFNNRPKVDSCPSRLPLSLPCPASCRAEVSLFKELRVAGNVFGPKLPHHPLYVVGPKAASVGMSVAELA